MLKFLVPLCPWYVEGTDEPSGSQLPAKIRCMVVDALDLRRSSYMLEYGLRSHSLTLAFFTGTNHIRS